MLGEVSLLVGDTLNLLGQFVTVGRYFILVGLVAVLKYGICWCIAEVIVIASGNMCQGDLVGEAQGEGHGRQHRDRGG